MQINNYTFGMLIVDGQHFHQDLIIFPHKILENWQREESHSLTMDDLKEVIEFKPDVLVIGTGAQGIMQIPDATIKALAALNIKVISEITSKARTTFNNYLAQGKKVVGAFHLTC